MGGGGEGRERKGKVRLVLREGRSETFGMLTVEEGREDNGGWQEQARRTQEDGKKTYGD